MSPRSLNSSLFEPTGGTTGIYWEDCERISDPSGMGAVADKNRKGLHNTIAITQPTTELDSSTDVNKLRQYQINYINDTLKFDETIFSKFTKYWTQSHKNWIGITPLSVSCSGSPVFPVCFENGKSSYVLQNECPKLICMKETKCVPTPPDTIDFLPPLVYRTANDTRICETKSPVTSMSPPYFGLDEGIPPLYLPVHNVPLKLKGILKGSFMDKCVPIVDAVITAWHVDSSSLSTSTSTTTTTPDNNNNIDATSSKSPLNILRESSCRGTVRTSSDGSYSFQTTVPPSYGPPRHINLMIIAPGYETLVTRVYFSSDLRLQQLTTLRGEVYTLTPDWGSDNLVPKLSTFVEVDAADSSRTNNHDSNNLLPGEISKDPRISHLSYIQTSPSLSSPSSTGMITGYYESSFDIVLQSSVSDKKGSLVDVVRDLNGLWIEGNGGQLKIEVVGYSFFVMEYPHPRRWGTAMGVVGDGVITGVNFRQALSSSSFSSSFINQPTDGVHSPTHIDIDIAMEESSPLWTSGHSTGAIIPGDGFTSDASATRISWTGGDYNNVWSRVPNSEGFRYLKLVITRDTGGYDGGMLVINEIQFYEGVLSQRQVPVDNMFMRTPRSPSPQIVTCSTFLDQERHCFRAFDGDISSKSSWRTRPVGSFRYTLAEPQWILLDLGLGKSIIPTAMRIICDAEHEVSPRGCPRTFTLQGSRDNIKYDVLTSVDMSEYSNEYSHGGRSFPFFWESPMGRPKGVRCGSCDSGPLFSCAKDAYDGTCASTYCGIEGKCGLEPLCPVGQYKGHPLTTEGSALSVFSCNLCPPGKFGATEGLNSSLCSGDCESGYYCLAGSTSPRQHECGGPGMFCPGGAGSPVSAGAGRRTVGGSSNTTRTSDELCERGHYCVQGEQFMCPIGYYGDVRGLSTATCTGLCIAGEYCPPGSVKPSICPKGHFCPDGKTRVACPAGLYGGRTGLKDSRCSGLCRRGYYCEEGSVSSMQAQCPGGRYGETEGLQSANCSGPCEQGYFCPAGSDNSRANSCGGIDTFCPEGSTSPLTVSIGHYSTAGDISHRSSQMPCEKGFFCYGGEKFICGAGTYGSEEAMSSSVYPLTIGSQYLKYDFTCSGLCEPGHYCPEGSTSATEMPCPAGRFGAVAGLSNALCSDECPLGHHCPLGTITPYKCRPGTFGNRTAMGWPAPYRRDYSHSEAFIAQSGCGKCWAGGCAEDLCNAGFYCPEGSISGKERECGDPSMYCPEGSAEPLRVDLGYYTVGYTLSGPLAATTDNAQRRISQKICEAGHYCIRGLKILCPPGTFGSAEGLHTPHCSGRCLSGHYCPEGSSNETLHRCPAGRYGATSGLADSSCTALCQQGYYCPEASTSATQIQCGTVSTANFSVAIREQLTTDMDGLAMGIAMPIDVFEDLYDAVFCPTGSRLPLVVQEGYYSMGNNASTRFAQAICPIGTYCSKGVMYDCPAGSYGNITGLMTPLCSGLCKKGYFCPPGSTSSTELPCPRGRYGDREGLTSALCSGPCQSVNDCPIGSMRRTPSMTA
eukprot:gene8562-17664_t